MLHAPILSDEVYENDISSISYTSNMLWIVVVISMWSLEIRKILFDCVFLHMNMRILPYVLTHVCCLIISQEIRLLGGMAEMMSHVISRDYIGLCSMFYYLIKWHHWITTPSLDSVWYAPLHLTCVVDIFILLFLSSSWNFWLEEKISEMLFNKIGCLKAGIIFSFSWRRNRKGPRRPCH